MLDQKMIIGLPVYTQDGIFLGKIINIETDYQQQIIKYIVKAAEILPNLLNKSLIIHPEQVISVDEEKMIVENNYRRIADPSPIPSA